MNTQLHTWLYILRLELKKDQKYTFTVPPGDYSMEEDRHLMPAEIPDQKPDLLIVESTYGVQAHTSRPEREARFTGTVERVVTRAEPSL